MGNLNRRTIPHFRILALSLALILFLAAGCEKQLDVSTLSPPRGSTTTPISSSPVGTVNNTGFYVSARLDAGVDSYFHERSTLLPNTCTIAETEPLQARRDIQCVLDVAELDLYYHGYSLNYNVPTTMCEYVELIGYYYMLNSYGDGGATIEYCKNVDGRKIKDYTGVVGPDLKPVGCAFDHTGDGGPNCCGGSYTLRERIGADAAACDAATASVLGTYQWGGAWGNCAAGPGLYDPHSPDSPAPRSKFQNLPMNSYILDVAGKGANGEWKVKAPMFFSPPKGTNLHTANYYDLTGAPPSAVVTPYFGFVCRDSAFDISAQIKVYVRSWDNLSGFRSQTADYTNPATQEAAYAEAVHDRRVWRDIMAVFPPGGSD